MDKFFTILLTLFFLNSTFAQKAYFQQEVNTKIDVTLNDTSHTVIGDIEIEYINNSPDELQEIYIHLWANAYKNRNTAFAKQQLNHKNSRFYFAKNSELGRYRKLNFTVDGNTVDWSYDEEHVDIAILKLVEPLKPGGSINIKTPLHLKIPNSFSRLGRVGQSYQMTQWFPKPAVYDRDGWHPMPYVDMGEFYSEFGSYDVKITLPENYVVGATGELQNESEKEYLMQRVNETSKVLASTEIKDWANKRDTFPDSSPTMKTLHYKAEQVHDFAFFADKRFYVQKSEVVLASGKKVDTWAMFTNAEAEMWKKGTFYVDRSVKFYSEHVGEYPYPHATAVQSALSAGGGMEYPMITVIGLMGDPQSLDNVITHEVGHNWFYGILAFNERDYVWMDEGMNSYYDHRYIEQYYEGTSIQFLPEFMMKNTDYNLLELAYLYQARRNLDQAPATHSEKYSRINYFLGGYEKPAVSFKLLERYLGTERFDEIMKSFYDKWKFKHPDPAEFRNHVEARTDKDLGWFFDGLIGSNAKTDYAFKGLKSDEDLQLKIKNKGANPAPFPVMAVKDGEVVRTQWYDGFKGSQKISFPKGDYDKLVIDKDRLTLDLYRKNNTIKTSGPFKTMQPVKFKFLTGVENSQHNSIYWLPLVTWNDYDKTMLGLGIYNTTIPSKHFEFSLAPMYSIASGDLVGVGNVKFHDFPKIDALKKVTLDVGVKVFNENYIWRHEYYSKYKRVVPSLTLELGSKANKSFSHRINARTIFLWQEVGQFSQDTINPGQFIGTEDERTIITEFSYAGENKRAINPMSFRLAVEQQNFTVGLDDESYLKASLTLNLNYTYAHNKNISFRIFGGYFFENTRREKQGLGDGFARGNLQFTGEGSNDYRHDDFYFGRTEDTGIFSQQIHIRDGGFKNALAGRSSFGSANDYLFTLNIKADLPKDLPLNLPLKPYFDFGYMNDSRKLFDDLNASHAYYSGGLMLEFLQGILAVYVPIVNSKALKRDYNAHGRDGIFKRITFTLDLNQANPFELVNKIDF